MIPEGKLRLCINPPAVQLKVLLYKVVHLDNMTVNEKTDVYRCSHCIHDIIKKWVFEIHHTTTPIIWICCNFSETFELSLAKNCCRFLLYCSKKKRKRIKVTCGQNVWYLKKRFVEDSLVSIVQTQTKQYMKSSALHMKSDIKHNL